MKKARGKSSTTTNQRRTAILSRERSSPQLDEGNASGEEEHQKIIRKKEASKPLEEEGSKPFAQFKKVKRAKINSSSTAIRVAAKSKLSANTLPQKKVTDQANAMAVQIDQSTAPTKKARKRNHSTNDSTRDSQKSKGNLKESNQLKEPPKKRNRQRKRKHPETKSSASDEEALKSTSDVTNVPSEIPLPLARGKWTNKQRVLIFSSRGISFRDRHLMTDLRSLMPHSKAETKMDRKDNLFFINEIAEMKNCNHCIYFEARKRKDLYMWISSTPNGPSAKFLVENVHTMEELKMTGNCLRGSRPLLSFDGEFETIPHFALLKEMFVQIFGTPENHPKSQPFVDHVFIFGLDDNRIWFRNYQIIESDMSLVEIGPRFCLNLIKVFDGSFSGEVLYDNPHYVSPNARRQLMAKQSSHKYLDQVLAKKVRESRRGAKTYQTDPTDSVFATSTE